MIRRAGRVESAALVVLVALAAPLEGALAQCLGPRGAPPTRPSLLISADRLSGHSKQDDIVILHVGLDRTGFERGHIPGARYVDGEIFLAGAGSGDAARIEALTEALRRTGISNESSVVLYGDPRLVAPAFLALDVLGHGERVSVLDGGLRAWRELELPISTAGATIEPGVFEPRPERWRVVNADWVRDAVDRRGVVIVDARSQEEYEADHIPTARQLDWRLTLRGGVDADVTANPSLRSVGELRRLFRLIGIDAAEDVVFYSDDVSRAAHLYFVARYLGYEPRYLGSRWLDVREGTGS